jgi:outer membrane protein OmpA-like peptidoglycan-associated protein
VRAPVSVTQLRTAVGLTALLAAVGLACATPPKPRELEAFDNLRKTNEAKLPDVARRSPDLMAEADRRSTAAHEEWQSNDLDEARGNALMAQIKLKTAIAVYDQDQLKAQIQSLSSQESHAEEELTGLSKDLASEQEKLALLQKYVEARKTAAADKERLSQEMTTEQQKAHAEQERLSQQLAAQQRIATAQLAMRTADTVNASQYAKTDYGMATDLLARAETALKQNDYNSSQAAADDAKKYADQAVAAAKPQYEQAAESNQNKARNDALARDAPLVPGVKVRIDPRGDLQRLVIVVPQLFNKRDPNIAPGHEAVLDGLASLLKKYPTYPVQVIGYTDNRGKSTELIAVSAARAQAVYSALAERGVDTKRLMVSGLGGEDPFVDNRTAAGRAKNNRVEIVFLYH